MEFKYDIGIVGSGPAGYTAALHARKKGYSVVLFEQNDVGGVCLNKGCIPTKAILYVSELYEEIKLSSNFGIIADNIRFDYPKVLERKNNIIQKLKKALELTIKNSGIITISEFAEIMDKNTIKAGDDIYKCSQVIAATGSKPREIKGLEFDHKNILSSDDILNLSELPKSIVIIGSGAIGTEWARILAGFDVEVSVVEMADNLLPAADSEVSKRVERIFKSKKIKIFKSTAVEKINKTNFCEVYLNNGEVIKAEKILVAIGRSIDNKNLIDGVEYVGDAAGEIQLAHFASKQSIELIDGIKFDKSLVPFVVYGNPEIAWVGKREQDLEEGTYKKSMLLISALGKSHCDNSTDGFIKILSQDKKIIGAHIVSKEASSLIQQIIIAMQNNITIEKLKEVCFAHPTYSEGIFELLFNI